MIVAGRLNRRVTLQEFDNDPAGGGFVKLASYKKWANVRGVRAREERFFGSIASAGSYVAQMRWSENIARAGSRWKIVYEGATYQVHGAVDPTGKREELSVFFGGAA